MLIRFRKPKPMRMLRKYRRVAWTFHGCWRCDYPITPGDEYEGEVFVGDWGLTNWKSHVVCPGPRHEDKDDEELRGDDCEERLEEAA